MKRCYDALLSDRSDRQMKFISGPRQVGKTTTCTSFSRNIHYYNWDNDKHRELILAGSEKIAHDAGLDTLRKNPADIVFDEIHKYSKWKQFLKGFFDLYQTKCRIVVTGSSRLEVYKKGGDSLMGRYFPYRMHPLTVGEVVRPKGLESNFRFPSRISKNDFDALLRFGGFPEPWLKADQKFHARWSNSRNDLLFKQDIRDLTMVRELSQIKLLSSLLEERVAGLINYSDLARSVQMTVDTVRRWIDILSSLYFCYTVRPWFRNVSKSLLKEPKIFLWDWSTIRDPGARVENFTASHLLKYVHWMEDTGHGKFGLYFIRDKMKREVDFLVSRDNKPFMLVEAKTGMRKLSPHLLHFAEVLKVPHAFQVVLDMDYVEKDCFAEKPPVIVPARTLFSQLV